MARLITGPSAVKMIVMMIMTMPELLLLPFAFLPAPRLSLFPFLGCWRLPVPALPLLLPFQCRTHTTTHARFPHYFVP